MNWEKLFTKTIRERGYTYYRKNKIKNLEIGQSVVEADVIGTHRYHVVIKKKNNEIEKMFCDCPYANDGNNCKHMAAVIYSWEERLKETMAHSNNKKEIEAYYKEVEDILEKCHTVDAFMGVDYFIRLIMDYIERVVVSLFYDKCYMDEFNVLVYIFMLVGELGADDSYPETISFMNRMHQLWEDIYDKLDDPQRKEMYELFEIVLDESENVFICDVVIWFILTHFEKYDDLCELYEERIDYAKNQTIANDWIDAYITYLEDYEIPEEEVNRIRCKYWKYIAIRKYYINCLIEWKQYKKALDILKKYAIQDKTNSIWYKYRMIDIYELQDNKEMLKKTKGKMLFDQLIKKNYADVDLYRKLKSYYTPKEWPKQRDLLMKALSVDVRKDYFYYDDEDYEGLMHYLVELRNLRVLEEYEDLLENDYSLQILELYASVLDEQVTHFQSRTYYKFFASTLRKMKHLKGGQEFVKSFVSEWKKKYKTRYALMEELEAV